MSITRPRCRKSIGKSIISAITALRAIPVDEKPKGMIRLLFGFQMEISE
jgi:hypothetical protein